MTTKSDSQASAIACDLTTLTPEARERHTANAQQLFASVEEVRELSNGYALRLPTTSDTIAQIAGFIAYDRQCCPFVRFELIVEPDRGPVWLQLSGGEKVREYLTSELACLFPERMNNPGTPRTTEE